MVGLRQIWHFVLGKSLAALLSPRAGELLVEMKERVERERTGGR